jgi:tetratricopeptide (TPR) repeat protein
MTISYISDATLTQMGWKTSSRERATEAQVLEDAERLIVAWNERQAKRMPTLFSPTIGAAITAGYWFLWVRCPACRTINAIDLRKAATRVDPTFADAWYNLSNLLDDQGRVKPPLNAYTQRCGSRLTTPTQCSISALLLQRTNQYAEAANYWRRYLASDCQSDWATRARRSLKFCEMQVNLIAYWRRST